MKLSEVASVEVVPRVLFVLQCWTSGVVFSDRDATAMRAYVFFFVRVSGRFCGVQNPMVDCSSEGNTDAL